MKWDPATYRDFNIKAAVCGWDPTDMLLKRSFPDQIVAITDPAVYKAIMCARRAGKSVTAFACALIEALKHPGSTILILGLTLTQVKAAYTKTAQKLLAQLPIHYDVFGGCEYHFLNGSKIILSGASAGGMDRIARFQGDFYRLVVVDEPQDFRNLYELINTIIVPALTDVNGKLILAGTPGHGKTYFYEIVHSTDDTPCRDANPWKNFHWDRFANPYVKLNSEEKLAQILRRNPSYTETLDYKRMYAGLWVTDVGNQIYHYSENINKVEPWDVPTFADMRPSEKRCVLAIDMGWHDATAFVIAKHTSKQPEALFFVHAEQHTHIKVDQVIEIASKLIKNHSIDTCVIDEKPQLVESIRERFRIPIFPLQSFKHDKSKWQKFADSQLERGLIKLERNTADTFEYEWRDIVWDAELLKLNKYQEKEDASIPNHLSDAFLYCVRTCNQYAAMKKKYEQETANDKLKRELGFGPEKKINKGPNDEHTQRLRDLESSY